MTTIKRGSQARSAYNEDFSYDAELPGGRGSLLVVGDFASSKYTDLDRLAEGQLKQIVESQLSPDVPPPLLLTSMAVEFNNRLLGYKEAFPDMSFQCCVAFAAVADGVLYYLTVGDCRVNVQRGESLILLSGSGWVDPKGKPLPNVVSKGQEMKRGYEEPPDQVLGTSHVSYDPSAVRHFALGAADTVLIYSDGVEKVVSPAHLLDLALGEASDPLQLIERVLDEVQARQGDDDRTLLVAAGPHPAPASEAHAEAVRSALAQQKGEEQRLSDAVEAQRKKVELLEQSVNAQREAAGELKALAKRVEKLDKVLHYVDVICKDTQSVFHVVNALPRGQALTAAVQNAVAGASPRDERALRELNEKVDHIFRLLSAGEAPPAGTQPPIIIRKKEEGQEAAADARESHGRNDGGQQHGAARGKGKKNQQRAAETQADAPQPLPRPLAEGELKPQKVVATVSPFREGVIHVTKDRLELLDETEVPGDGFASDALRDETFMSAPEGASPGWLTAAYLYLRHLDAVGDNGDGHTATPTAASEGLPSFEQLDLLPPELLLRLRRWHWQLRERRRALGTKVEDGISAEEMRVAGGLFYKRKVVQNPGVINLAPAEGLFVTGEEPSKWKSMMTTPAGLFVIGFIIAALSLGLSWLLWGRGRTEPATGNQNTNTQGQANAGEGETYVQYGADGRAIILKAGEEEFRTRLRLPYLHEDELSPVFSAMKFTGTRDAVTKLTGAARDKGLSLTDNAQLPEKYAVYPVKEADDEKCTKLLYLINQVELKGVKVGGAKLGMTLEELQTMNPGLRCKELAVGDKVLGKGKKWQP